MKWIKSKATSYLKNQSTVVRISFKKGTINFLSKLLNKALKFLNPLKLSK